MTFQQVKKLINNPDKNSYKSEEEDSSDEEKSFSSSSDDSHSDLFEDDEERDNSKKRLIKVKPIIKEVDNKDKVNKESSSYEPDPQDESSVSDSKGIKSSINKNNNASFKLEEETSKNKSNSEDEEDEEDDEDSEECSDNDELDKDLIIKKKKMRLSNLIEGLIFVKVNTPSTSGVKSLVSNLKEISDIIDDLFYETGIYQVSYNKITK